MRRRSTQQVTYWKGLVLTRLPWTHTTAVADLPPGYEYHHIGRLRFLVAPDGEQLVLGDGVHWRVDPRPEL